MSLQPKRQEVGDADGIGYRFGDALKPARLHTDFHLRMGDDIAKPIGLSTFLALDRFNTLISEKQAQ